MTRIMRAILALSAAVTILGACATTPSEVEYRAKPLNSPYLIISDKEVQILAGQFNAVMYGVNFRFIERGRLVCEMFDDPAPSWDNDVFCHLEGAVRFPQNRAFECKKQRRMRYRPIFVWICR